MVGINSGKTNADHHEINKLNNERIKNQHEAIRAAELARILAEEDRKQQEAEKQARIAEEVAAVKTEEVAAVKTEEVAAASVDTTHENIPSVPVVLDTAGNDNILQAEL